MIKKIYAIKDQRAQLYNIAYFKSSHGEAEREFHTLVNNPEAQVNKFPEEFELYFVASYDDNTGLFEPLDTPQHVAKATDLKVK